MMWQFGELGYGYGDNEEQCLREAECPPSAPGRTAPKPIRWDARLTTVGPETTSYDDSTASQGQPPRGPGQ